MVLMKLYKRLREAWTESSPWERQEMVRGWVLGAFGVLSYTVFLLMGVLIGFWVGWLLSD